ncbi:MAG: VWA domain-containing protein [Candidatus Brocadiia bacterium]
MDYIVPRTESLEYAVPWKVSARISSKRPISTVYSPSHELKITRKDEKQVRVQITDKATREPGPFRLSFLRGGKDVAATLFAYPDPSIGGGYFLLLAGLPPDLTERAKKPALKREVTLVLDRSGSMRGGKIRQVREAALQIIGGLHEGEAFNIILYNQAPDLFAELAVVKNEENARLAERYLKSVNVLGGTNIHDALLEALRQKPRENMLPLVLFLTDGIPTVGKTSEIPIRDLASAANPHEKRVFTIGVGGDVNAPLLRNLAEETRATSTFVLPKEDVEVKVANVFQQLKGPVLSDPELKVCDTNGRAVPGRVKDVLPQKLPDLFEGDQLTVLGKYIGEENLQFQLTGNYFGERKTFRLGFDLSSSSTKNGFVSRLWASRKIGFLVDAVRRKGADTSPHNASSPTNPEIKELVEEITRLSTEFGILTEYTAFLAREGTDLSVNDEILARAERNFQQRAVRQRVGWGAVNQSVNIARQKQQLTLNRRNEYFDQNLNRIEISTVQQVNDLTFYRRGNRWIDSNIADKKSPQPDRVISFDSPEFYALAEKLASQDRQGSISLQGEIVMEIDGKTVLVKN